jgi:hypothetical protein
LTHSPATTRPRRQRPTLWQRLSRSKQARTALALAAAIAVPAMAAPAEWNSFGEPEAALAKAVRPMPFEQAGHSFPGSAFYFIEAAPRLSYDVEAAPAALFDPTGLGGEAGETALAAVREAGPAARGFLSAGSGMDKARALQCLATAIYYEAASESLDGQRAVAQVVLNRVAHPSYPNSVCGVVYQGSERRTGCQFSFTCDGSLRRVPSATGMARARMIAGEALSGKVFAPVGLATHYHTVWIYPYWAPSLAHIGTIGAHRFYKWRGNAGRPEAFRSAYLGGEPVAAPSARRTDDFAVEAPDPVALARVFEDSRRKAETEARTTARAPAPTYSATVQQRGGDAVFTAENLPAASGVRPEYANAGKWIAEPGSARR